MRSYWLIVISYWENVVNVSFVNFVPSLRTLWLRKKEI